MWSLDASLSLSPLPQYQLLRPYEVLEALETHQMAHKVSTPTMIWLRCNLAASWRPVPVAIISGSLLCIQRLGPESKKIEAASNATNSIWAWLPVALPSKLSFSWSDRGDHQAELHDSMAQTFQNRIDRRAFKIWENGDPRCDIKSNPKAEAWPFKHQLFLSLQITHPLPSTWFCLCV